jgi:hypothetical protein
LKEQLLFETDALKICKIYIAKVTGQILQGLCPNLADGKPIVNTEIDEEKSKNWVIFEKEKLQSLKTFIESESYVTLDDYGIAEAFSALIRDVAK